MEDQNDKKENERQCQMAIQAREERWIAWRYQYASTDIWTERMLTGLREGIKGKKWFSLADKVWREQSLQSAYAKVSPVTS